MYVFFVSDGMKSVWSSITGWASKAVSGLMSKLNPMNWFGGGGKHAYNGLSYVPYDQYNTVLHKGERVLTAEENKEYSKNKNTRAFGIDSEQDININIPVVLNGQVIARVVDKIQGKDLALERRLTGVD